MGLNKQWVQHVSGHGEKWEVLCDSVKGVWEVAPQEGTFTKPWLPKSEFRLCDPPEQWVDVTSECYIARDMTIFHDGVDTFNGPYRRRKVHLYELKLNHPQSYIARDAFIIEKKVRYDQ